MVLASLFFWWYGAGWQRTLQRALHRLERQAEFFSVGLLLKTLFSPYRQISAGAVRGNLTIKWHAFIDRSVSRIIGAVVRFFVLIAGLIVMAVSLLAVIIWLILWPLLPFSPIIFVGFAVTGWVL